MEEVHQFGFFKFRSRDVYEEVRHGQSANRAKLELTLLSEEDAGDEFVCSMKIRMVPEVLHFGATATMKICVRENYFRSQLELKGKINQKHYVSFSARLRSWIEMMHFSLTGLVAVAGVVSVPVAAVFTDPEMPTFEYAPDTTVAVVIRDLVRDNSMMVSRLTKLKGYEIVDTVGVMELMSCVKKERYDESRLRREMDVAKGRKLILKQIGEGDTWKTFDLV